MNSKKRHFITQKKHKKSIIKGYFYAIKLIIKKPFFMTRI